MELARGAKLKLVADGFGRRTVTSFLQIRLYTYQMRFSGVLMRKISFIFIAISLSGCATANDPDTVAATNAWSNCVADAVKRLDDRKSDPVSIATGISPQCAAQYRALTDRMVGQFITEGGRENMRQKMKEDEIKEITSAVLIFRSHPAT